VTAAAEAEAAAATPEGRELLKKRLLSSEPGEHSSAVPSSKN